MKIKYIYEDRPIFDGETDSAPRVGEMVYLEEIFFVEYVVWYPEQGEVRVYLSDRQVSAVKPKVVESKAKVVNLQLVGKAQKTADAALKEATELKRQVFSIRQYLKNQPKAPTKNDT